jgi:hypothetical protein
MSRKILVGVLSAFTFSSLGMVAHASDEKAPEKKEEKKKDAKKGDKGGDKAGDKAAEKQ